MEWKASLDINHVDSNNNKSISAGRAFTRMFKQIEKVYKRLSWVAKAGFCVQETCGLRVKVRELGSGVHKETQRDSSEHMAHFINLAQVRDRWSCLNGSSSGSVPFRGRHDRVHVLLCVPILLSTIRTKIQAWSELNCAISPHWSAPLLTTRSRQHHKNEAERWDYWMG